MKTMNRTICLIAYLAVTAVFGAEEGQGVFNGDIGFIVSIDPQEHVMSVQFDDERVAEYEGADRTAEEMSQLLYHLQVMMIAKGITLEDVYKHL